MSEAPGWPPKKEELIRLYEIEKLSAAKIATKYGLKSENPKSGETLVLYYLRKFGINRRDRAEHVRKVTSQMVDEWVRRYEAGESLKQIAGHKVGPVTVFNHLKRRGVHLRDKVEAQIKAVSKYERRSFSGDELEKAYLMGLRYGDLHVVRHGRAVRVRVSTTHPAMANLFDGLFSPYGHVSRYPREANLTGFEWTLECDLDVSFSFLLHRAATHELRSMSRMKFGFFLAGFFDAEGSIYFHQKLSANFEISLTNTNKDVLSVVLSNLIRTGYHPTMEHKVQDSNRFLSQRDGEIWRLCLRRNDEVIRFLRGLSFRHEEKREKARLALDFMTGESVLDAKRLPEGWADYILGVKSERDAFVRLASEAIHRKELQPR